MHGIVYFIIYLIIRALTQKYKYKRFLKFYENNENCYLNDIGFKYIPIIKFNFLDDIIVLIPVFICIYLRVNTHDFLVLLTIIYVIREITTSVTLLPPTPYCINQSNKKINKSEIITRISGLCNETVFSGHTTLMLLSFLFILPKVKSKFLKILIYFYLVLGSILILALRSHYTLDVFLAWTISILVYLCYFGKNIYKSLIL